MAMDTFSDDEKRFLLAEMIKASQTNVDDLVQFVKTHAIGFTFWSIVAPPGRSLEQCVRAAEGMLEGEMPKSSLERASVSTTSSSPTKRVTANLPLSAGSPTVREASVVIPPMYSAPPSGQFSPVPSLTRNSHVPIKPRPRSANDLQVTALSPTQSEGPPVKKRRGRPPRKPIDYSLPPAAPKPIAPSIPHSQHYNHSQHLYPSTHTVAVQFLPTGTPKEASIPGTPTRVSGTTPPATNAQIALTSGTTRGRKRTRQPTTESSAESRGNPRSDIALQTTTLQRTAEGQLLDLQNPPSTANSELKKATMTTATDNPGTSAPRYAQTHDRPQSIPPRGPTLAPFARGEPSAQINNSTKKDRHTPSTP